MRKALATLAAGANQTFTVFLLLLVPSALFSQSFSQSFAAQEPINFSIPPQALGKTLVEFSSATGIQFLYTDEAIHHTGSEPLEGLLTVEDALHRLFAGTDFDFEFTNPDTVRIFRQVQAEAPAAAVEAESAAPPARPRLETADHGQTRNDSIRLNEIIVTSRRREESLQDIPGSVTAFGWHHIEASSIENVEDLNVLLPNVNIRGRNVSGNAAGQFSIRGVTGVARYVDGVPQHPEEGALFNILDLERIEILRGPQGTLFGKNALSGAIHYITRKPGPETEGRVLVTGGSFRRRDVIAGIDFPLGETVFTRLSAGRFHRDGYVSTGVAGFKQGEEDNKVVRGQIAWEPGPAFNAVLTLEANKSLENRQGNVLYDVVEEHPMVQAYNDQGLTFTDASDAFGKYEQYRNSSLYTGPGDLWEARHVNLNLLWSTSAGLSLRSITGARTFDWGNYTDMDASRYAFFEQWRYSSGEEFSQELQLQRESDQFNWTLGLYYGSEERITRRVDWQFEEINPRPTNSLTQVRRVDRAVFAEGGYALTQRLSLAAGLRYSLEQFSNAVFSPAESRPPWERITKNHDKGELLQTNEADFDAVTPRLSLQYDWHENVMTYLSYSEGFNGGGVNNQPVDNTFIAYDGERLKQWEAGLRTDLFQETLRLNATYFNGRWSDIQVGEVLVPGTLTTLNAGKAKVEGLEVETVWAMTSDFTISAAIGWLDSGYTSVGSAVSILLDSPLALAPKKSFTLGATYGLNLGGRGFLDLVADYGWLNEHVSISDFRLQKLQPSYGLLSARVKYTSPGEDWSIAVFGTNLTDEWYQLSGFAARLGGVDQGVVARPREFGASIEIRF